MSKHVLFRLLRFTRPYGLYLVAALFSAVLSVSLGLYAPVLIGNAIDLIVAPGRVDFPGIFRLLLLLGGVCLAGALFQWLMTLCTNVITYSTVKDLRTAVFAKLARAPLAYIDKTSRGDLISRVVNDIDQVSDGLLQGFSQLFTGVITIVGTLCFMLSINVMIATVVVVLTPVSLFVASFIAKHTADAFRRQSAIRGELGGCVEEMIGGQRVVKAFGFEERSQEKFDEINNRLHDVGVDAQFYSSTTNPVTRFVNGLVYAAVGITGALAVIGGKLTVGQLSSFLNYANQYTKPFNEISGVVTELQTATASVRRVFAVLDELSEAVDASTALVLKDCEGHVQLDDVSFSYSPDRRLIEHLNLTATPGQRIAIVGPTGCGKTTIINLLMRFYDVDSGRILVDSIESRGITRSSLRGLYGMVLQDTWMFSGTVRENIAYGKPDATLDEVIAAAKAAHAHSFIKRLPQGYDTALTESGGISQGQKQLLCIARIMLTSPPMLILDEATSSIDTRTEVRIQKAFADMTRGRTSFVVAHRLSTIREADCILVMCDGHIIEQGQHQELLQKGGFYADLYRSQFAPSTE